MTEDASNRRRPGDPIRRDGVQKRSIDKARSRVMVAGLMFAFCFCALSVRLVQLGLEGQPQPATPDNAPVAHVARGEITDRNGIMLATNLDVASLYADTRIVPDPKEAARRLVEVLPDLDEAQVLKDLTSGKSFIWLRRKLSPRQQWAVNALGIPGLSFREESNRIYPQGRMLSHAVGFVDVDNHGLEGLEKEFDSALSDPVAPGTVVSSIDVRVQHALHDELLSTMQKFKAKGAAGVVMNVNTGEVLGMVSLPDFDPQHPGDAPDKARFNYVTKGVYEMGSPFKSFTIAAALQNGTISIGSVYDATNPIHIARFTINDDHPQARPLSVPEIFLYSSNIGAAKIGVDLGADAQKAFFQKVGLMTRSAVELPEVGSPLLPANWGEITTMTASFGHGIAVSPLQLVTGISALVNGGLMREATILSAKGRRLPAPERVISPRVSRMMSDLMRLVVTEGTGKNASAAGYQVGGKTGTAEKSENGGYARKALISSFIGIFPTDAPKYAVFAMFDEPQGIKETFGYATGGWTAAPVVGKVISRIGPILGVYPHVEPTEQPKYDAPALLASYGVGQ